MRIETDSLETTIIYVRHGEVPGNVNTPETFAYTGCSYTEGLNELGHKQAQECAEKVSKLVQEKKIENVAAIYSSKMIRAVQTATPVANKLRLTIQQRENLREIDWGCANNQLVALVKNDKDNKTEEARLKDLYPRYNDRFHHLPVFKGAEKYTAVYARTLKELQELAEKHRGQTILVFGHGRVLKTLMIQDAISRGVELKSEDEVHYPKNCTLAQFIYAEGKIQFKSVLEHEGSSS